MAIGELARQRRHFEDAFALHHLACFARRFTRFGRERALGDDEARILGMTLEIFGELLADHGIDCGGHFRAHQLVFGLVGILGIGNLHRDHRAKTFAKIFTGQGALAVLGVFEQFEFAGVRIDRARDRLAKSREVRAAITILDRVGKAGDEFAVTVVPLQRNIDGDAFALRRKRNDIGDRRLVGVEMFDVVGDAAFEHEVFVVIVALIGHVDVQAAVEIGELA